MERRNPTMTRAQALAIAESFGHKCVLDFNTTSVQVDDWKPMSVREFMAYVTGLQEASIRSDEDGPLDLEDQLERALDTAFPSRRKPACQAPLRLDPLKRGQFGPARGAAMSFLEEDETTEEHERRIVRCSSCRARIIWLKTKKGANMPVDADTVKPSDTMFDPDGDQISHFASCPNSNQHRTRKPRS
jgi:hypothetical protein